MGHGPIKRCPPSPRGPPHTAQIEVLRFVNGQRQRPRTTPAVDFPQPCTDQEDLLLGRGPSPLRLDADRAARGPGRGAQLLTALVPFTSISARTCAWVATSGAGSKRSPQSAKLPTRTRCHLTANAHAKTGIGAMHIRALRLQRPPGRPVGASDLHASLLVRTAGQSLVSSPRESTAVTASGTASRKSGWWRTSGHPNGCLQVSLHRFSHSFHWR